MSKITIDLKDLQDADGNYTESQVKNIESLTGKPFKEVVNELQPMDKPDKSVTSWSTAEKLDFIGKHGRKEYENLLKNA